MSLEDSVISQRSGNIQKAVIVITDLRGRNVVVEPPVEVQGGGLAGTLSSTSAMKASAAIAGESLLADAESYVEKKTATVEGVAKKSFYVQFNPNELSFSGYAGRLVRQMDYSEKGGTPEFAKANARITMNVKLIFDKTDSQDAFMGDKFNMSASSIVTGTAKAALSATGKKDNSVQTEVEGLIAALRSRYTRQIAFYWGTMSYTGILNRVSVQYTMFNVLGLPIRAYVNLSLTCADERVIPGSMGPWMEHYEQLFGAGDVSYVKAAQKLGNVINFNI